MRQHPVPSLQPPAASLLLHVLLLTLLATFTFGYRAGLADLRDDADAVQPQLIFHVVHGDGIILPRRNGVQLPEKPMLYPWLGALAATVRGSDVDLLDVRLPAIVAGIATVLATYAFATAIAGPHVALWSGLILITTPQFAVGARDPRVDMVFTAFCVAAIMLGWRVCTGAAGHRAAILTTILASLAVLAKGPLGLGLVVIVLGLGVIVVRPGPGWRTFLTPAVPVIAIGLPSAWYLTATALAGREFLELHLIEENVRRLTGGLDQSPPWYYVEPLVTLGLPWTLLLPWVVRDAVQGSLESQVPGPRSQIPGPRSQVNGTGLGARDSGSDKQPYNLTTQQPVPGGWGLEAGGWRVGSRAPSPEPRVPFRPASPDLRFVWVWFVGMLAFFTLSVGKRRAYLLPLRPALAILVAAWLVPAFARWRSGRRPRAMPPAAHAVIGAVTVLALAGVLALWLGAGGWGMHFRSGYTYWWRVHLQEHLLPAMVLVVGSGVAVDLLVRWWLAARYERAATALVGLATLVLAIAFSADHMMRGEAGSFRPFAEHVNTLVPAGAPLAFQDVNQQFTNSFLFHLRRPVAVQAAPDPQAPCAAPAPGFYLMTEARWEGARCGDDPRWRELARGGPEKERQRFRRLVLGRYGG